MRIAIVYDAAYPWRLGGGEKRNWEVARRLASRGHDVTLLSLRMWDGEPAVQRERVRCLGVCPWRPEFFKAGKRSFGELLAFSRHLSPHLKRLEFDLVDCANFPYVPCISAKLATLRKKSRLVVTWYEVRGLRRWIEHKGTMGFAAWILEVLTARLTRHHVAISSFTQERGRHVLGMRHMEVVPCGVSAREAGQGMSLAERDQVLCVGRLVDYKRVDLLIRAYAELPAALRRYRLRIVGDGPTKDALARQAKDAGLAEQVSFAQDLSEEELRAEYSRSRVLALPSEQEGFGIVIVEAMASGTPVIANDAPHSAAGELVADGKNGILIKTKDQMVDALTRVLTDDAMWQSFSESGQSMAAKYDWDEVVSRLESYYERVVGASQSDVS